MRRFSFIVMLFFIGYFSASSQKVVLVYNKYSWYEGVSKARAEGKFFLLYISQKNCEYCKALDKSTLADKSLITFLNEKFVLARHHVTSPYGRAIALDYHLSTTPALMVQNPNSEKEPLILYGVKDAETLKKELMDYIQSEGLGK